MFWKGFYFDICLSVIRVANFLDSISVFRIQAFKGRYFFFVTIAMGLLNLREESDSDITISVVLCINVFPEIELMLITTSTSRN